MLRKLTEKCMRVYYNVTYRETRYSKKKYFKDNA